MQYRTKLIIGSEQDFKFDDNELNNILTDRTHKSSKDVRIVKKPQTEVYYNKSPMPSVRKIRISEPISTVSSRYSQQIKSQKKVELRSQNHSNDYQESKKCSIHFETLPIQNQFENGSFMAQNNQLLMNNISEMNESIKLKLLSNQYELKRSKQKDSHSSGIDNKIIFILFNTLQQLDKKVISSIFNQAQIPVEQFKLKHLQDSIDIISEMVTLIMHQVCKIDIRIASFIESFWKFQVILFDLIMQWINRNCNDFFDYQIQTYKQQLQEVIQQKSDLQERLINAEKEFSSQQLQYKRKCESLECHIEQLEKEYNEYQSSLKDLGNLKLAEKRMNNVGLKSLELDNLFKEYDRELIDLKKNFHSDFKQLGALAVQQKKSINNQSHIIAEKALGIEKLKDYHLLNNQFLILHPFSIYFSETEINDQELEQQEFDKLLLQFLDYYSNLENQMQNICQVFIEWVNDKTKLNSILSFILTQSDFSQHALHHLFQILFGIKHNHQLQWKSVSNLIRYYKYIKSEIPSSTNELVHLHKLDDILPEEIFEHLKSFKFDAISLITLMNLLATYTIQQENQQWIKWKQNHKIECSDFDQNKIVQFQEIMSYNNYNKSLNTDQINDIYDLIRCISAKHPTLFYLNSQKKNENQVRISTVKAVARSSQLKRQSTINCISSFKSQLIKK